MKVGSDIFVKKLCIAIYICKTQCSILQSEGFYLAGNSRLILFRYITSLIKLWKYSTSTILLEGEDEGDEKVFK